MKDRQDKKNMSRRDFMKAAGITTAGIVAGSFMGDRAFAAPAAPRVLGANDRINYAVVGVGGMGGAHLHTLVGNLKQEQNIDVIAVCDVFDKRRQAAQHTAGVPDSAVFSDYRKLLENKDIDVVVVATPDHTHAPISITAMEAGKHVYVEKPMTKTFDEAVQMYDTAKRTNRMVQIGSQGCSDAKWSTAGDLVKAGRIGKVIWAQGSYCRNNPTGEWNYGIDPDANENSVDWDLWLGPTPDRPWSPERFFRWRKYWDYGNGIIGDLWPHRLHPLMIAMALPDFPKRVACLGTNPCNTDEGHGEPREVAEVTMLQVEFPNGEMIFLAGSTVNERGLEDMIRGQKANIFFGGGRVSIMPERPFVDEIDMADVPVVGSGESHTEHHKNMIHALRTNCVPNCPIELGLQVQTIVSMAETSYRESKMMQYDPEKREIFG